VERRLVELAQRGDRGAFSELAVGISPRLFTVAQRILRDYQRAEDATQLALISIWRKLPNLSDPDRFEAWAYRILVNSCYSEARNEGRRPRTLELIDSDATSHDASLNVTNRDLLERAFARLTGEQRAVLVLQYYLGMGHPEIADVLEIPIGTVKSRASSGRRALRAAVEADSRPGVRVGTA
jgi:RNA polymerase sigma-70 factor, ECF subfamily